MSARALFDGAFANIPDTIRFPWDVVEKRVEPVSGSSAVIESGGFTVLGSDEPTQPKSNSNGDDVEVGPEHVDFTGAFGDTDGGAVNMEEVEQAAADKQAEMDYLRRLDEEKAAQAARTAAAATPANSRTAGRKTARSRGIKTVSSDPDSIVLEEAVDISGLLVAQWEKKREEVNTKEQLALLMGQRAAAGEGATCVHSGSICLYDPTKGYGFLAPDVGGPDIYFGKDSITGWAPEAVAEAAFPTNALTRRVVEEFPPYLIPGERVQFDVVQPEDQQGGRGGKEKRVRATMVKGEEGTLLLTRAIKEGKRLRGVIRQMNLDNFKGHIQFGGNADGSSRTEPTQTELAGMSVVERAHAKGFVDACFTHPCVFHGGGGTVHASSESLQRGTLVEYTILRDIDVKTGKPIAVCIVPVGGTVANLQVNPSSGGGGGGGQRGGRRVDNAVGGQHQQQQMLLFDDGDTGTW